MSRWSWAVMVVVVVVMSSSLIVETWWMAGRSSWRPRRGPGAGEDGRLEVDVKVSCGRSWVRHQIEDRGGIGRDAGPGLGAEELILGLTLGRDERVDVDERLHVGVARGGVGDDGAAIGVADQDN